MKIRFFLIASSVLILPSSLFAETAVNAAADDACKCLEAPYEQVKQAVEMVDEAMKSGELTNILVSQDKLMEVMNTAQFCFEDLRTKYPEIDTDKNLQQEVMNLTDEKCPNPALELKNLQKSSDVN